MDKTTEKLADKFLRAVKSKGNSGPWSLVLWAIGFILIGLMLYISFRKSRELAKLRHEKNVTEEKQIQALADREVAKNKKQIAASNKRVIRLKLEIAEHDKNIKKLQKDSEQFEEKLKNVKDWKTVNSAFGD